MAVQSLRERLRPWHALMVGTFLVGTAVSLRDVAAVGPSDLFVAVLWGLLAVVVLQFTVGNVWGYVVEYLNTGGSVTDLPFLAPFGVGAVVALAILAALWRVRPLGAMDVWTALWGGFWAFAISAALVAVAVWFLTGYRETAS